MKYIRNFDTVNEKITWKEVLLGLAIGVGIKNTVDIGKNFYEINHIYKEINSTTNYPEGEEKKIIENVRKEVISQVKNSNLFNKFGKEYIIDSLEIATIKIVKTSGQFLSKNSAAVFIHLDKITEKINKSHIYRFSNANSSKSNVILINRDYLNEEDLPEILTHEIYHYVDALYNNISKELNMSKYIDKNLKDEKYALEKTALLLNIIGTNELSKGLILLTKSITKSITDNIDYLGDSEELFARWKTFKGKLVKLGYIENSKSIVNTKILAKIINDEKLNSYDLDILLILDFNKIEEFDSLIN